MRLLDGVGERLVGRGSTSRRRPRPGGRGRRRRRSGCRSRSASRGGRRRGRGVRRLPVVLVARLELLGREPEQRREAGEEQQLAEPVLLLRLRVELGGLGRGKLGALGGLRCGQVGGPAAPSRPPGPRSARSAGAALSAYVDQGRARLRHRLVLGVGDHGPGLVARVGECGPAFTLASARIGPALSTAGLDVVGGLFQDRLLTCGSPWGHFLFVSSPIPPRSSSYPTGRSPPADLGHSPGCRAWQDRQHQHAHARGRHG